MGKVTGEMGTYPEAIDLHQNALKIYLTVYGPDHPQVAGTYRNMGITSGVMGAYPEAMDF